TDRNKRRIVSRLDSRQKEFIADVACVKSLPTGRRRPALVGGTNQQQGSAEFVAGAEKVRRQLILVVGRVDPHRQANLLQVVHALDGQGPVVFGRERVLRGAIRGRQLGLELFVFHPELRGPGGFFAQPGHFHSQSGQFRRFPAILRGSLLQGEI